MPGEVQTLLRNFYTSKGISEANLSGKAKIRAIRIKISCSGINLANFTNESNDPPEVVAKVKNIINNLET
ncbi:MAG: hypothetical protein H7A25_26300 [Leptospiraceae bacterium]|nr:hypothetical protein [Leptospiraceae bacterium]MCP5503439.1 hypothetical protein [Leptospiraceae bacterium]